MVAVLDLTSRQVSRVLNQAARAHTTLLVDARPRNSRPALSGTLDAQLENLLRIRVDDHSISADESLLPVVGAYCDVQMSIDREQYAFSTCIVDVLEANQPRTLMLAKPEVIHVTNRRQFVRYVPDRETHVRLWPPGAQNAYTCRLVDIGPNGLACRAHRGDLDEVLFVGDDIALELDLQTIDETFAILATLCSKTLELDRTNMTIGFEFNEKSDDPAIALTIERLRACLNDPAQGFVESEGT